MGIDAGIFGGLMTPKSCVGWFKLCNKYLIFLSFYLLGSDPLFFLFLSPSPHSLPTMSDALAPRSFISILAGVSPNFRASISKLHWPNERCQYYVLMCIFPALWSSWNAVFHFPLRLTSECFQTPAPQSSQSLLSLVSIKFSFMSSERFDFNIEKHVVSYCTPWQFFVIVVVIFFRNRREFHVINSREKRTS